MPLFHARRQMSPSVWFEWEWLIYLKVWFPIGGLLGKISRRGRVGWGVACPWAWPSTALFPSGCRYNVKLSATAPVPHPPVCCRAPHQTVMGQRRMSQITLKIKAWKKLTGFLTTALLWISLPAAPHVKQSSHRQQHFPGVFNHKIRFDFSPSSEIRVP